MGEDIRAILEGWPYEEGRTIRRILGKDGRTRYQVRTPLGIEQYEVDGRPDGLRPEGHESWLDYYQAESTRRDDGFSLGAKDCERLRQEGLLYYHRYLLFFQIGEHALCARDTARNLCLFDFVQRYAERDEDREELEQYRPYVVRMNTTSRAIGKLEAGSRTGALEIVRAGIRNIQAIPDVANQIFRFERDRSIKVLQDLARQIRNLRPRSRRQELEEELREAIARENYERAAVLRDEIRRLARSREKP